MDKEWTTEELENLRKKNELLTRLENLINSLSLESNTPDFILASYLCKCLAIFEETVNLVFPKEGDINSHRYILRREAEYLNVKLEDEIDVQALLDEITTLRQELLEANTVLNDNNLNIVT